MGVASKVCSVILRVTELIAAAIVAGIVGQYLSYINSANGSFDSKMVYTVTIAGLSIFFAIVCMPPLRYSFYFFGLDFIFFILWMVSFGLLVNLAGTNACNSTWYWQNWGYYWGGFYTTYPYRGVPQVVVGTTGCSKWRAALAWIFIGGWCWLLSSLLGVYVFFKNKDAKSEPVTTANLHTNDKTYEETGLRENTAQVPQSGVSHSNMV